MSTGTRLSADTTSTTLPQHFTKCANILNVKKVSGKDHVGAFHLSLHVLYYGRAHISVGGIGVWSVTSVGGAKDW